MTILNKKELKIFLSLLLIYIVFAGFGGWNENSLLSLTFALGFENRLTTDSFVDHPSFYTMDRLYLNGHWYSPNTPGLPILGAVIVKISKLLLGDNVLSTPWKTHILILLLVIFTSGVASAGTSLLIYKISRYFTKNEKIRLLVAFAYGLGTMAFLFGTRYRSHATAAFLSFLCFYLIFKAKKEKKLEFKSIFLAGLAGGLSIITDLPSMIIVLSCFILLFYLRNKDKFKVVLFFSAGLLIPLTIFFIYNYFIFGNIFSIGASKVPESNPLFPEEFRTSLTAIHFDDILIIIRDMIQLLFLSYRGLLIYSPILFFSLVGIYYMFKEYKLESILIITNSLVILVFVAGSHDWWCHGGAGCRRFLPFIPFLFIPLIYAVKRINFKIVLSICFLSIFINLLTIQAYGY
ncbi:MAG: hypothetical protein ACFFG0_29545, partial [Candidatus Thorarchaeota archaeon]